MGYRVIFSDTGRRMYDRCLDYLLYYLGSAQAARGFLLDMEATLERLRDNARAYAEYEDYTVGGDAVRKVHLKKYSYKLLYVVRGEEVIVVAVMHDKQDVEGVRG